MYFKIVFSVHDGVIEFFFCGCRHVFAPFVVVVGLAAVYCWGVQALMMASVVSRVMVVAHIVVATFLAKLSLRLGVWFIW